MLDMIYEGGIMMIPLFLCSILVVTIAFERGFSLRRKKVIKSETVWVVENVSGKDDINKALSQCRNCNDAFSNIINATLTSFVDNPHDIKEYVEEQGRIEVRRLEKRLVILETIAGIAPLLGLLGTVLGMIEVFDGISIEGITRTASLSSGISEALITTVAGLSIGIFALVFYNYFTNKAEDFVLEIEHYSARLIKKLQNI